MNSGDVEFAKVGASTLIIVESLRRFIEGHRSTAALGRPTNAPD